MANIMDKIPTKEFVDEAQPPKLWLAEAEIDILMVKAPPKNYL